MSVKTRLAWLEARQPLPPKMFYYQLTTGEVWQTVNSPLDVANHPPAGREICAWLNPPALEDPLSASLIAWMVEFMRDGGRSFREEIKNLRSDDVPAR